MISMSAMQPVLPPEPICIQASLNQENAGEHPLETKATMSQDSNTIIGSVHLPDQDQPENSRPNMTDFTADPADHPSMLFDQGSQEKIEGTSQMDLEKPEEESDPFHLLMDNQNNSDSGSSPLTSPQLPEKISVQELNENHQQPAAPLTDKSEAFMGAESEIPQSEDQDRTADIPVILLDQEAMTFELPEAKGSILVIEENGRTRTISVSEGFTTLSLEEGDVTIRLLDADGNVIQIWKTSGINNSSPSALQPDLDMPPTSNEQPSSLQVIQPDQDQPVFVAKPDLNQSFDPLQMVAIQQVEQASRINPGHTEVPKPILSAELLTPKPAATPVQAKANPDLSVLNDSLGQPSPLLTKGDLLPKQNALSAALDELNTTPFPALLDILPPGQASLIDPGGLQTADQAIASPDHLQTSAAAASQSLDSKTSLLNSDGDAASTPLFDASLPAVDQISSVVSKPQTSQAGAAPITGQELKKTSTSFLTGSQMLSKERLNLAASTTPITNAVLKANKRSFQSGNRLYIKDPSALRVHVDHGSVQAMEVRSQQSNKVYPDLEEAVKAEKYATFDVKAKIQSEDKQISQASWTVIPIGQPVQSQIETRNGRLDNTFALSEEGKVVAYQQEKRQQPILCRGFDPVKTDDVRPGETLRMYVDDKPGLYQVRINGKEIQTSLQKDELGQSYLPVPAKLGSTKLRVLRDGKTVYTGNLECSNPFRSLKLVGPVLGAAAGLILDVRRRKLV